MEVVLGEAGAVVAVLVHVAAVLADLLQHALIEVGPLAGHALHDFFFGADRRQVKGAYFH